MSKTTGIKCPHCDAPIEYDGSERYVTCEYCGSKVEVTGENEFVFHTVDEAEVQKTKTERAVRLKELDAQMAQDASDTEHQKVYRIVWFSVVGVCLIVGLFGNTDALALAFFAAIAGYFGKGFVKWLRSPNTKAEEAKQKAKAEEQAKIDAGYIRIPPDLSLKVFPTVNVVAALQMLQAAGFTDISVVNLRDLTKSDKYKKGIIDKVVIDGANAFSSELYSPDAKVLVQYHDYPNEDESSVLEKVGASVSAGARSVKEAFISGLGSPGCPNCGGGPMRLETVNEREKAGCGTAILYFFLFCTGIGIFLIIPLVLMRKKVPVTYAVCQNCGKRQRVS